MININRGQRQKRRLVWLSITPYSKKHYPQTSRLIADTISRNFSESEIESVMAIDEHPIYVTERYADRTEGYGRSKSVTNYGPNLIAFEFSPDATEDTITHEFNHAVRACRKDINPSILPL